MNATMTFCNLMQDKKKKIIDAAIDEFATHTYDEANLDRIAANSGVSKGSLFQYFENKSNFYCYSIRMALERAWEFHQLYMRRRKPADCFETLVDIVMSMHELKKKASHLAALYLRVVYTKDSHRREELFQQYVSRNDEVFNELIDSGQKGGWIDAAIPTDIVKFHLHAVGSHLTYLILSDDDARWLPKSPKRLRDFVENAVTLSERALNPKT